MILPELPTMLSLHKGCVICLQGLGGALGLYCVRLTRAWELSSWELLLDRRRLRAHCNFLCETVLLVRYMFVNLQCLSVCFRATNDSNISMAVYVDNLNIFLSI